MEFLGQLWLPIVISAVLVWIASFLMHMVLPHHKGEWKGLPDEARFNEAVKGVPAGQYMFPWGSMKDMKDPAFQEKLRTGPSGMLQLRGGPINMGQNLILTFLTYLVIGIFVAYILFHFATPADPYMQRFRLAGAAAFLAYVLGWIPQVIWYGPKGFVANVFDGIVYTILTAGSFAGFWHAVAH